MPTKFHLAHRLGARHGATIRLLVAASLCLLAGPLLTGCSSTQTAAFLAKASPVEAGIVADVSSPAGQQLIADVESNALNLGLAVTSEGKNVSADIAAVQGAASAVRDYEGLPVAPSSAIIAQAAAAGTGVESVAKKLAPGIETIIANTLGNAKAKGVLLKVDTITEAIARGFDAVAGAKIAAAEGRAKGLAVVCLAGTPGEAP